MSTVQNPATEGPWTILARAAGHWAGTETFGPGPRAPSAGAIRGRSEARLILGGRGIASDYVQETDGEVTLSGHTIIRWDEAAAEFVMHFFGEPWGGPTEFRGRAEGDSLVLEGEGSGGPMRQSVRYRDNAFDVQTEGKDPVTGEWLTLFEAHYERIFALETKPALGRIAWTDLTVKDAPAIRDFWAQVAGWSPDEVSMGEYADFNMRDAEGRPAAGVCHARGSNADLPPVWLSYVSVADLDVSLEAAVRLGGEVAVDPRGPVGGRMAVVRDPAGAMLALWEAGEG